MPNLNRINPLLAKILTIVLVTLALLVPLARMESLIAERAASRESAVDRVAGGVGHGQRIGAVMMVMPVVRSWTVDGKERSETKTYRWLANTVDVSGEIASGVRKSGIYSVPTFRATLHIAGSISGEALMQTMAPEPGVAKRSGKVQLFLALSDPSGIRALDGIRVDDTLLPVSAEAQGGLQGVAAELESPLTPQRVAFSADLVISGTRSLQLLPFAESTHVNLTSSWPHPSFSGAFFPDTAPQVNSHGFAAVWRVLEINRDYPRAWADEEVGAAQIGRSAFGVDFYQPVDAYQRDYRSIHYAVLFISLTFMALFLWEHTLGAPIHAMQYAMTGTALSIFYLVLTALSEHLNFAASYASAACAMALLLAVYFSGVMKSRNAGLVTGAVAGVCYSLLYLLVLSEDYALLLGALAVFGLLAATMIATRSLNWHRLAEAHRDQT